MRKLSYLAAVGLLGASIGLSGCASSSDRNTGQKISDRQVARAVNKQLSGDPTFKYTDVQANVYNGNVQLSGFVETPEQRMRAAELASQTKGVRQVINGIMIKATPTGRAIIRDPLGKEGNQMLLDTNSPPQQLRNMNFEGSQPQQPQNTESPKGQETNPK